MIALSSRYFDIFIFYPQLMCRLPNINFINKTITVQVNIPYIQLYKSTMRKVKAGKKGQATKYISRAKAIRKLQLSLKDFRRLCILKGVYPREPPKKLKKHNRTYYHLKDVNFLALDPLISKIRAQKVYVRKYNHAKAKGNVGQIKYLAKHKPKVTLNHLVRQRYPDFLDALRDLDDPLSLMALFTIFPTHKQFNLSSQKIQACTKLLKYFQLYVIRKHCLKKVFVSIKGIYYQCEILGQKITYIVPYKYPPNMPIDVDYRVMSTFLDFYITLIKFINYKLYVMEGLQYPPEAPELDNQLAAGIYKCYQLHKIARDIAQNDKYKIDEQFQNIQNNQSEQLVFKGLHFYLSTQVPRQSLQYTILSNGGTVTYEFDPSNQAITHVITDRQNPNMKIVKTKQYVQPQWVFDSLNFNKLLNVKQYWYNLSQLPPHISPFTDEKQGEERYIPDREKQLRGIEQNRMQEEEREILNVNKESTGRQKYDIEYEKKQKQKQKKKQQQELKFISKNVISNTNKKLLKVIEHGKKQQRDAKQKLQEKAKQIKSKKRVKQ